MYFTDHFDFEKIEARVHHEQHVKSTRWMSSSRGKYHETTSTKTFDIKSDYDEEMIDSYSGICVMSNEMKLDSEMDPKWISNMMEKEMYHRNEVKVVEMEVEWTRTTRRGLKVDGVKKRRGGKRLGCSSTRSSTSSTKRFSKHCWRHT